MSKTRLLVSCAATALFVSGAPAFAQTQTTADSDPQTQPCAENTPGCEALDSAATGSQSADEQVTTGTTAGSVTETGAIVVTGSRIRKPNLSSPVPVTSLTAAELPTQGQANIGDALNDLPSLRSTYSSQNSGRFIGTAGLNFLDLRGLGPSRTLVLVNGRRHVTASAGDFIVDVQTIPADLIERIDIVTGGESAVYGSDAIAGVVNFVLKRDFEGIRASGQAGVSDKGDRGVYSGSITAGQNFSGGRGNVAVNFEYVHSEPLYYRQREHWRNLGGFLPVDDTVGESAEGDGKPDNAFFEGPVRLGGITLGGSLGFLSLDGTQLAFAPNGNLVFATPDKAFLEFGSGSVISDNPLTGATLQETGQLAVGSDRYAANLLAHYDFSDAFRPFIEAKYVHLKVLQEGQPSFFQGYLSDFFGSIVPDLRCNNPFLNAQALGALQSVGLCANPDTGTFPLSRFNVDFGARSEISKRDTYRIVGGVEGDFNDDWHYEVSVNYGHFKSTNIETNDLQLLDIDGNPAAFSLAIDAARDPATGQIVCRVNIDGDPSNDAPGCVPLNVFGNGAPSAAALNYINTTSYLYSKAAELDIMGYVSGDLSQLFELPGGPIGFSVGTEYRRETAYSVPDPLSASGATFFNAFKEFDPPAFEVKEVFGELNVPLLKDLSFADELSVSGAVRYSDYNTSANHTFAYNINGIYAPIPDVRFRANYSRSVRVPTLNDLYSPATQNFAFLDDPCNQESINEGGANRATNCAALGVPTTIEAGSPCVDATHAVGDPWYNCAAEDRNVSITSAGNPDLEEETGKSLTIGVVLQPSFLPGFSLTADYYDIEVTNLIAVLGGQTILNQCVDLPDINNQYCGLIAPRDQYGLFADPALTSAGVNFAKYTARGIDFDMAYVHTFDNGFEGRLRGLATYTLERRNYTSPVNPDRYDRVLSNLGDPVFSGSITAGLDTGPIDLQYSLRYIGQQTIFAYSATHQVQDRPPENPDVAAEVWYPETFYHAARVGFEVDEDYEFYLGVDNIFDTKPPFGATGTGAGSAIFDNIGRYFYAGFHANF